MLAPRTASDSACRRRAGSLTNIKKSRKLSLLAGLRPRLTPSNCDYKTNKHKNLSTTDSACPVLSPVATAANLARRPRRAAPAGPADPPTAGGHGTGYPSALLLTTQKNVRKNRKLRGILRQAIPLSATTVFAMNEQQASFLRCVVPPVLALQQRSGLPASVILAQAVLESGWGRSLLARRNKNLFGIKARSGAAGAVVYTTTEYAGPNGAQPRRQRARFAAYPSYEACLRDYARLIARPRYARARAVAANPFAFAVELQRCGYATDPRYARKLHLLMRRYQLTRYDLSPGDRARLALESSSSPPAERLT